MKRKRLRKAGLVRRGWSGVVVLEFDTVRDRRCLATSKGGSPHWRRVYLQRIYAHEPPSRLRLLSGCVEKPSKRTEQSIIGDRSFRARGPYRDILRIIPADVRIYVRNRTGRYRGNLVRARNPG